MVRLSGGSAQLKPLAAFEEFAESCGAFQPAALPKLEEEFERWMGASALALKTQRRGLVLALTPKARNEVNLQRLRAMLGGQGAPFEEVLVTASVLQKISHLVASDESRSGGSRGGSFVASRTIHDERFSDIVRQAIAATSSDIHFRMRSGGGENSAAVLLRIDGELEPLNESFTPQDMLELVAAGFAKADDKSLAAGEGQFNVLRPLSAFIRMPSIHNVELRFQSAPERYGFDVAVRVLNYDGKINDYSDLSVLGYLPDQEAFLTEFGHGPGGSVLFVGQTGSGKTTALNTLLAAHPGVRDGSMYASTLEDPPEGRPPNVSQFAVARAADQGGTGDENPFVAGLRVRMRSDGDIIVIGEIRDSATAEMFAQLSMSGHKVYASFHAASARGAYERLASSLMRMSFEALASEDTMGLTVFQTLAPRLCPHCRIPAARAWTEGLDKTKLDTLTSRYGLSASNLYVRNHKGCPHCRNGRKGLQVVAEMFAPNDQMRQCISRGEIGKAFYIWRKTRTAGFSEPATQGKTAFEVALYFVNQGVIGVDTLDSTIGRILTQEVVGTAR